MKLSSFYPLILLTASAAHGRAGSIDWGSSVMDQIFDAQGNYLSADYSFEMGVFADNFVPSAQNLALWESKWKPIEKAAYNAPMRYVTENSILTASGSDLIWQRDAVGDEGGPLTNPNLFKPGDQVYVWAFNNKSVTVTSQWALITGDGVTNDTNWTLSLAMGDALAVTRNWRFSNADTAIVGGLNNLREPGNYSATPGTFTLQTTLIAIPEPTSTLLLAAALSPLLRRRRPQPNV
jgi:hypothetical protein